MGEACGVPSLVEPFNKKYLPETLPSWRKESPESLTRHFCSLVEKARVIKHIYGQHRPEFDALVASLPAVRLLIFLHRENVEAAALSTSIARRIKAFHARPTSNLGVIPVEDIHAVADEMRSKKAIALEQCQQLDKKLLVVSYESLFHAMNIMRRRRIRTLLNACAEYAQVQAISKGHFDEAYNKYLGHDAKLNSLETYKLVENHEEIASAFPTIFKDESDPLEMIRRMLAWRTRILTDSTPASPGRSATHSSSLAEASGSSLRGCQPKRRAVGSRPAVLRNEEAILIRYDLDLFLSLNEEYRSRPLVPRPPVYHPEALEARAYKRAKGINSQAPVKGLRVLEIGCGRGEVCRALAQHFGCQTVGVDIAEYPEWKAEVEGTRLLRMDLSSASAPDIGQFDLIYSNSVWEHVRHPYSMLKKAFEVLKPGGTFLLSANLYRGPKASHRYRQVFFPWPHLLFTDEVFAEFYLHMQAQPGYKGPKGPSVRPSWVNQLTIADYYNYFNLLGFQLEKVRFSITPLDEPFLARFADKLDRFPRYDLERDFIHATLRKPGIERTTP